MCVLFGAELPRCTTKSKPKHSNQAQNETNAQSTLATLFAVCFFFFGKSERERKWTAIPAPCQAPPLGLTHKGTKGERTGEQGNGVGEPEGEAIKARLPAQRAAPDWRGMASNGQEWVGITSNGQEYIYPLNTHTRT